MQNFISEFNSLTGNFKKASVLREELNYIKIPVNKFECNTENIQMVNNIINWCKEHNIGKIKRTKSGGISVNRSTFNYFAFDLRHCGSGFELTLIACGYCMRIQLGHCDFSEETGKDKVISGTKALRRFTEELKKDGINIKDYAIENGEEVNEDIVKPKIKAYVKNEDINKCEWIEHCHHLDFHKAYMSGLYASHPEMRKTIQRLYDLRHTDETIKSVFTNTIGKMHSKQINWKFAGLAKDAINTFNDILDKVSYQLAITGHRIIAYNTDGIWYTGDVFTNENTGDELTQFDNDYIDTKIRFKSDGAYEFWYNGKLYTKLRGRTRLDSIKKRDKDGLGWDEGDIFKASATVIKYTICKDNIIEVEDY